MFFQILRQYCKVLKSNIIFLFATSEFYHILVESVLQLIIGTAELIFSSHATVDFQ